MMIIRLKHYTLCFQNRALMSNIYDVETKWMKILIKDVDMLKKHNDTWNKVSNNIEKQLEFKPIYNKSCGLTVMRLQIFVIEKYLKQTLTIFG